MSRYTLSGDAISLYGPVGLNGSSYTVQMDDSTSTSYNALRSIGYQMLLYHTNNLGPGNHTLMFTCLPVQEQICGIDYVNIYRTATNDSTNLFGQVLYVLPSQLLPTSFSCSSSRSTAATSDDRCVCGTLWPSIHSQLFSPAMVYSMHCSCTSLRILTPYSRSPSTGNIVGIAIGSAAALIAISAVALYFIIRQKNASQSAQYSAVNPFVPHPSTIQTSSMTVAHQRRQVGNVRESVRIG